MTQIQRIIKYFAMAFAILLTVSIISGVVGVLAAITGIYDSDGGLKETLEGTTYLEEIYSLDIDIKAASMTIQNGDSFSVETNSKYITHEEKNGKVTVREKKHSWFGIGDTGSVVITIPADTKLQEVKIDAGAGDIEINCAVLNNLKLDMGVGELDLTAGLTGICDIDFGVGEANLTLIGSPEEYRIRIDKGLGKATLDGENMKNETYYGTGSNLIEMDGGIGNITIKFQSEGDPI